MSTTHSNNFPKLHNAAWPGVVGKGNGGEPPIDLETMLDLTVAAEVDGVKFDGVDVFLFDPHIDIDISDADLQKWAERITSRGLVIGSVVAPIWPPTGGGSAMGADREQEKFLPQIRKGCRVPSFGLCAGDVQFLTDLRHDALGVQPSCGAGVPKSLATSAAVVDSAAVEHSRGEWVFGRNLPDGPVTSNDHSLVLRSARRPRAPA